MEVPVYIASLGSEWEERGALAISLVVNPAIKAKWEAFSDDKTLQFSYNEEQQIIAGPVLIADLPIYRKDPVMGEYYVVYPAPIIRDIVQRYAREGRYNSVNIMHSPSAQVYEASMVEMFCIDKARGINPPKGFEYMTDGSWWAAFKLWDKNLFEACKDTYQGFSLEGVYNLVPSATSEKDHMEQLIDELLQFEIITI